MSDSTSLLDQLSTSQTNLPTRINETQDALSPASFYGRRASTSTGLTWGYYGGRFTSAAIANSTVTLTASTTNYVVADKTTGAVSVSTSATNWNNSASYLRLYLIVTGATTVTSYEDHRQAVGAGGSGGSLTGFTASANTASPNDTVNASMLLPSGGTTDQDGVYAAKGLGAVQADLADGAAAGGNKRGANAVDWQILRAAATQVASGANAFLGGGYNNTASGNQSAVVGGRDNVASGVLSAILAGFVNTVSQTAAAIVAGGNNVVSAAYSFIGAGSSNTVSADYSGVVSGSSNTASGVNSFVGGGSQNTASGENSFVPGGRDGTTRGIWGVSAHGAGRFAALGDAQAEEFVLRVATTDATPTALTATGAAASATIVAVLPNSALYGFEALVSARNNANGDSAVFKVTGAIKRGATAASTAILGTPTVTTVAADAGASAWTVQALADTTLGALELRVTGAAATSIKWVARVNTTEVVG